MRSSVQKINHFFMSSKLFFKNAAISGLVLSVLSALISYLKNWILARSLTLDEFGFFIYVSTIIGWISTIAMSGLNNGLLSFLVSTNQKYNIKNVVGWVLGLSIKRGFIAILISFVIYYFINKNHYFGDSFLYFSLAFLIPISISIYSISSVLIYQGFVVYNNFITTIVLNGGTLILLIILQVYGLNLYALGIISVVPSVLIFLFLIKKINIKPIFKDTITDSSIKKSILHKSIPILLSSIFYAFWIKSESFFLGINCGEGCIANFYVPFQFAFLLTIVNTVMYNVVASNLSQFNNNLRYQRYLYKNASYFIFYINLFIFSFIYLNTKYILSFYGLNFLNEKTVIATRVLSICFLLYSYFGATAEVYLNMLGKHKILFYSSIASLLVSIASNSFFTIKYGIVGAVISFSITILFTSFQRAYYIKKHFLYNISFIYPLINLIFTIFFIQVILYYVGTFENTSKEIIISNILLIFLILIFLFKNIKKALLLVRFLGLKNKFSSL
jgi:O-antigen/teichoic acid export membrane protein